MEREGRTTLAAEVIGRVKSGSGKSYEVKWDAFTKDVYVAYAGWTRCGKADSVGDAMRRAEAFLYDR
jgi:hypothetical protein